MNLDLPGTPDQLLFWSSGALIWMLANYALPLHPASRVSYLILAIVRVLFPALVVLVLGGVSAWVLALLFLISGIALPAGRAWLAPRRLRAEVELTVNALALAGAALAIGTGHLSMGMAPGLDIPTGHWTAIWLVSAGAVFLLRGGAEVVRGILEKAGSIPVAVIPSTAQPIGQEFNRGRLIGYLERLLIMAIIMAGQYAALGVLVAAKGLIRSHELERLDFAEYFLIGTLASITVAFFVGLGLRALVLPLW
ncbi:MAG: hypothetical protein ABI613_00270 [Gemmatimonadota bacterium]